MTKETESTMEIPITLNRASLGGADRVFGILPQANNGNSVVGHFVSADITVLEQPVTGEYFSGRLQVKIVEEHPGYTVVEVEAERGKFVKFSVPKAQQP